MGVDLGRAVQALGDLLTLPGKRECPWCIILFLPLGLADREGNAPSGALVVWVPMAYPQRAARGRFLAVAVVGVVIIIRALGAYLVTAVLVMQVV